MSTVIKRNDATTHADQRESGAMRADAFSGERVQRIVAEVLRRLELSGSQQDAAFQLMDGVVSLEQIEQIPASVAEITVSPGSVLTPSARDAIRERGLRVSGSGDASPVGFKLGSGPAKNKTQPIRLAAISEDRTIESGLLAQVQRRGVSVCPKANRTVIVASKPAAVAWQAQRSGWLPLVVNRMSDIRRFADQAPIDCWVLDSTVMNFMATVNAVVAVASVADFAGDEPSVRVSSKGVT